MSVSITLYEKREVTGTNLYSVNQKITASTHIDKSIFVFNTADETYAHVATLFDMENIASDSKVEAEAAGEDQYRLAEVTKTWSTMDMATEFSAYNKSRLQSLIDEYDVYTSSFEAITTTVYNSAS